METEDGDSFPSREESERGKRHKLRGEELGSAACESLRRLDSAVESRSRDQSRRAGERMVDSLP